MEGISVASFTDAWIETAFCKENEYDEKESHLLQMRGLKLKLGLVLRIWIASHLLQMRGLKPFLFLTLISPVSRIFYRCVD